MTAPAKGAARTERIRRLWHGPPARTRSALRRLRRLAQAPRAGRLRSARVVEAAGSRQRAGRLQGPAASCALARRQADRRVRRGILARQIRADQRDLLCRLRRAPAADDGGAHDDVPHRASLRRGATAVDPVASDRDAAQGRYGDGAPEFPRRVGDVPARSRGGGPDERDAVESLADEARAARARTRARAPRGCRIGQAADAGRQRGD